MPEILLTADGVVSCRNYQSLGYRRMFQGAYAKVPGVQTSEWDSRRTELISRAKAAVAAFGSKGAVLYGSTALEVLGVSLPETLQEWDICHLAIPAPLARPSRQSIIAHRIADQPVIFRRIEGLPILHPVDHWLQLTRATIDQLVEVGDGFVRRQRPLLSMDEVHRRIGELTGVKGIRKVRFALRWVVQGTDSLPETRTRLVLVRAGLPRPVVNCAVYCHAPRRTYHVDMGYEDEKVAVEYDGAIHVGNRAQMEIDAERRMHLQNEGWMVITVTAAQLRNPEEVVRSVEAALHMRRSTIRT